MEKSLNRVNGFLMRWNKEEDKLLLQALDKYGEDWAKVADVVMTRDKIKCRQRWEKVLNPTIVKGRWTETEDVLLSNAVGRGISSWQAISKELPGRTAKHCRDRWINYINPDVNKAVFSVEEDLIILKMFEEWGGKWAHISRGLVNRCENSVRLRYRVLKKRAATAGDSLVATAVAQAAAESATATATNAAFAAIAKFKQSNADKNAAAAELVGVAKNAATKPVGEATNAAAAPVGEAMNAANAV